jgi:hemolysin activation/secretion protein
VAAGYVGMAQGQQPSRPPPVDPQQAEKNIDAFQFEQQRRAKPPLKLPKVSPLETPAGTEPLFVLRSVSIEGAYTIPAATLTELYAPYLGRSVSQTDLRAITNAISERYRTADYHLSRAIIPVQDVQDGHLRIQVIEGVISELEITGNDVDIFGARKILEPVIHETPARFKTLERQLLIVNDTPGVRVADTALDEIGIATGRFRLAVKLTTWRIYSSFGLDNAGTSAVGPLQAYSAAAFNSYLAAGDSLAVSLATVPDTPRELRFGRISYDVPIGIDGVRVGVSASDSEVWPGDERRNILDRTVSQGYELRGSATPLQTRKSSLSVTVATSMSDPYEKTAFGYNYQDHIRLVSLAADYKVQDPLNGWNYATVALRQGIAGLGASQAGDPLSSRVDASPDFAIFAYAYNRYQTLSKEWSVKTSLTGQFASGPLLSSQRFYLGGAAFGPGYFSGDNGVAGSAELRFDRAINSTFVKEYQLYAFVDGGRVWDAGGVIKPSLASVGAGLRFLLGNDLQGNIAIATPIHYTTRTNNLQDVRILFSLSKSFKWCPSWNSWRCS